MLNSKPAEHLFRALNSWEQSKVAAEDLVCHALGADPDNPNTWPWEEMRFDLEDRSINLLDACGGYLPNQVHLAQLGLQGYAKLWLFYDDGSELCMHLPTPGLA